MRHLLQFHPAVAAPPDHFCFNSSSSSSSSDPSSDIVLNSSGCPAFATDDDDSSYYIREACNSFIVYLNILYNYYIPIIVAVGFLGNFLSCVVFLTTHLKMRSSSYYLAALAVADFGFLGIVLLVQCSFNNVFDIYNTNGWCQFFVYVSSVCACLSVWLIVAFTVERFIAVQYPLQRPHICTVSRAKTVVITLTLLAMVFHLYLFWIAGIINENVKPECEMYPEYFKFMKVVNFVDTLAMLVVPVVLIISMNAMIARNLFLFRRRLQASSIDEYLYSDKDKTDLQHSNTQSGMASLNRRQGSQQSHISQKSNNPSRSSKKGNNNQVERCPCIHVKISARTVSSARNQQNITKMLLLISSVFIALNFPSYVLRLWAFAYALQEKEPPETLYCLQQFAMMLYYTHFSINFLLYAMCGVTFRRCLWQLLSNNVRTVRRLFSRLIYVN